VNDPEMDAKGYILSEAIIDLQAAFQ